MSSGFGYSSSSNRIKNFKTLQIVAYWAGGFGVFQSIAWMALTIIGIIAYNCVITVDENLTYGSLVSTVFLDRYFLGHCKLGSYNRTMLFSVDTVLDSTDLLIWNSVYLAVAVCWFIASCLIVIYIRKDNAKLTAGVCLNWVFITLAICLMDLALGIIFGIDYGNFLERAYDYNLEQSKGAVNFDAAQLVAAMVTSMSLMIISFKGFVLWIINFGLMIYLLVIASRILKDKDGNDTLFMPRKDSEDIPTTRPPINAYGEDRSIAGYTNDAFVPENTSMITIELNQEAIARAARMSTEVSSKEHRFRNLEAFQQYPPPRNNNYNNMNNNNKNRLGSTKEEDVTTTIGVSSFPAPDYTPPMQRANQGTSQNGGILRNQRY